MAAKTKRKEEYLKSRRKRVGIVILIILIAIAALYMVGVYLYKDRFINGTTINGINVSNMTEKQAEDAVQKTSTDYSLTLKFRNDETEEIKGDEIDFHFNTKRVGEVLSRQNPFVWIVGYLPDQKIEGVAEAEFAEDKLREVIMNLPETDEQSMVAPENAKRQYKKGKFMIKKEVMGTTLEPKAVLKAAEDAIAETQRELDLEKTKGVYSSPEIYSDDVTLNKAVDSLNALNLGSVTYDVPSGDDVVVNGKVWFDWLTEKDDGTFEIEDEKWTTSIQNFVDELAKSTDTVYSSHQFETYSGNVISVRGVGYYGYKVNTEEEAEQLSTDLKSGEVVEREPVYSKTEESSQDDNYGFGSNYVEVNLSAQHLWVYRDGSVVVDTDVVSGKDDDKHRTPSGAYFAYDKQRDKIMRGDRQEDGSYGYTSHADYWIRLTGEGVGLHDATWRSDFGGDIWRSSGSHGCINIPPSVMPTIYEKVDEGMPVVVYY